LRADLGVKQRKNNTHTSIREHHKVGCKTDSNEEKPCPFIRGVTHGNGKADLELGGLKQFPAKARWGRKGSKKSLRHWKKKRWGGTRCVS